jgi:hypothetical protein
MFEIYIPGGQDNKTNYHLNYRADFPHSVVCENVVSVDVFKIESCVILKENSQCLPQN